MVARFYDEINAGNLVRVRDGQVIEHWGVMDAMKMMQQLGAMPDQAPA
jgi:predicted SnoaL-like aldol condensation-catalyzing enzyme